MARKDQKSYQWVRRYWKSDGVLISAVTTAVPLSSSKLVSLDVRIQSLGTDQMPRYGGLGGAQAGWVTVSASQHPEA